MIDYKQDMLELVAQILKMPVEEVAKHRKEIPEHRTFYFWSPARGGNAVIVSVLILILLLILRRRSDKKRREKNGKNHDQKPD